MKINADQIHPDIRHEQLAEFEREIESFKIHQREARQFIKDCLSRSARVLCLDVSQGAFDPDSVSDRGLVALVTEFQFDGGPICHGAAFRSLLGFDREDPRFISWDVARDPDCRNLPNPAQIDAFIVTGGPAMPSELHPGRETKNTPWLRKAVRAIKILFEARVPGLAFCLGHQLLNHALGAQVGRLKDVREFGTVVLTLTEAGRDLRLLDGVANGDGSFLVNASHSEAVITPPDYPGMTVVAANGYSAFQAAAFPLVAGGTPAEADARDELVVSIQNHPELLAQCLEVLRRTRREAIRNEGLDIDHMIFRDTPGARKIFLNFLGLVARRANKGRRVSPMWGTSRR